MADVELYNNRQTIRMTLHKDWIQLAKASAPFQLRNVEIQEPNTNIPFSERSAIYVEMKDSEVLSLFSRVDFSIVPSITELMTLGPRPAWLRNVTVTADARKILLVHGYCAGSNEFPVSQFTNSALFTDYEKSRSNDQFALQILGFGTPYSSYSLVAHSQGGLASTHLKTYYWSPADVSPYNGRVIQSVGSPYHGSGLSGVLADMGVVFGIGCGANFDLTHDGAINWASKIPISSGDSVYYYTTQYDDYWWLLPNDCVSAANVVLAKPNDGTTEVPYAKLAGSHLAGHKKSWCHTNGMKYPAQCTDPERNAEMNRLAAR